jgi:uncharacterized damage-inducible protein DinB
MTNQEFFANTWEKEQAAFVKVLRALPDGQLSYRPHERSTSAGDLAWQLAEEQRALVDVVDKGEIHWEVRARPDTVGEIVEAYETATKQLRQRLPRLDDAKWNGPAKFLMGGKVLSTSTVQEMFWGFFFDLIHHRGQLSAYIRPMGGKVPSIYGPSADDSGT